MTDTNSSLDDEAEPTAAEPTDEASSAENTEATPEGAGCMPAIVAGTLLMGIMFFVTCGVSTWFLWQQRTQFAIRTLEGYIPTVEQSLLSPEEKLSIVSQLEEVKKQMQAPDYEPARAAAIMQRLVRLPLPQWGELDAIESFVAKEFDETPDEFGESEREQALKQIARLRRAVSTSMVTVIDVNDVLLPATMVDNTALGRSLIQPLSKPEVQEVIERARLMADRAEIADKSFPRPSIADVLRRELQAAKTEG